MMKLMRRREKGFTLLEVMLVVIIIGIIAIIALPRLLVTKTVAEEKSCDSNLQAIRTQLECFQWDNGKYPGATGDSTITFFMDRLDATYDPYWPETSEASANCPVGDAYEYAYTSSNEAAVTCAVSAHSNN